MENEICLIRINDEEHRDLYADIISVEAEDDARLAGVFNIRLAIRLQRDGTWTGIDDDRLAPWNRVSIFAGFTDNVVEVIRGYITHLKPYFGAELSRCYLDVKGMDGSVLMNREEKLRDWPNKKDSDIATEIFGDYGLTPRVEDTEVVHDEAVSTIIQRETDIQFLKRLARRNGYECYVHDSTGYFQPPQLGGRPQPVLAIHFGADTNLASFTAEVRALQPADVQMYQPDLLTGEDRSVTVDSSQQRRLGRTPASGLCPAGIDPARNIVKHAIVTGQPAMQTLCQGLYDDAAWLLNGEGEITGSSYRDVLKARETVTIRGIGSRYSGVYYVTKVKHYFDDNGYTQHFSVKRNALNPDGTEDFGAGSRSAGGVSS